MALRTTLVHATDDDEKCNIMALFITYLQFFIAGNYGSRSARDTTIALVY